jgi:molecular chaperone DnaK (HSP70)
VKLVLGSENDLHARVFASKTDRSARGGMQLRKGDGSAIWVEEALAHLLTHAKELAEAEGKEKIQDVVVTVRGTQGPSLYLS